MRPINPKTNKEIKIIVSGSQAWLANFSSERTRATYLKAMKEFASLLDVRSASDLARRNHPSPRHRLPGAPKPGCGPKFGAPDVSRPTDLRFHCYARKAGTPEGVKKPHTAWATFITQALENKCPIEAVQRSLGHSK